MVQTLRNKKPIQTNYLFLIGLDNVCVYLFYKSNMCLFQDYSKECVAHVQKYLMKHEVPPNLFEVRVLNY